MGLSMSHLIELVGNDNCRIEMLPERLTGARMLKRKRGEPQVCAITFESTVFDANDAFAWSCDLAEQREGSPRKVGYIVWIDEDKARAAVEAWKASAGTGTTGER